MDRRKSLLLIDGGLISAANFGICAEVDEPVLALTVNYGQSSFSAELIAAKELAGKFQVAHEVLELPWMKGAGQSANRNGVLIQAAAALAASRGIMQVVFGFTVDQAEEHPDLSAQYLNVCNLSLRYSTQGKIKVVSYTEMMKKSDLLPWKAK